MRKVISIVLFLATINSLSAQLYPANFPNVIINNETLDNPWAGGLDLPQFSAVDFNNDGKKDIVIFDQKGNKWITFLNTGNANYVHAPQYDVVFPASINMGLMRDYNCDGNADIFTHTSGGIQVWKQEVEFGNPSFELEKFELEYFTGLDYRRIYKYNNDIPAIEDFDSDGDLDILSFDLLGTTIPLYKNMSVEGGYGCDSLIFEELTACWGNFRESNSDNAIELNFSCKGISSTSSGGAGGGRHTGSTLLAFDPDSDNDKDLLLGDIAYNNLVYLNNGGTNLNANMTSTIASYPANANPVEVELFPAAFYLDLTGDNVEDIVVAPNSRTLHNNINNIWLYEHTSNAADPFQFLQKDFLVEGMIDFGSFSHATFFDHNQDGLEDLIVSNGYVYTESLTTEASLFYFENTGTASSPEYTLISDDYQNMKSLGIEFIRPAFGDIDDDGDDDLIIGDEFGNVHLFTNTAGIGNEAVFSLTQLQYFSLDVGNFSHPQLADLNQDGLLDLVVGRQGSKGEIAYYWNYGTAQNAQFSSDSVNDKLGNIHVEETGFINGFSSPCIVKENGVFTIYVGSDLGFVHEYAVNPDSLRMGSFNEINESILPVKVGIRSTLSVSDINNDGEQDFVFGNSRGGILLYSSVITDSSLVLPIRDIVRNELDVSVYPNPSDGAFVVNLEDNNKEISIEVFNALGARIFSKISNGSTIACELDAYSEGVYFIQISDGQKSATKKLILR